MIDNKKRILDSIITKYGRSQLKNGLDVSFVSFSDQGYFYDTDDGETSKDISNKLIFEASSLPKDIIIPLINSEGNVSIELSNGEKIINSRLFLTGTTDIFASTAINIEEIYSGTLKALNTTINNFSNNFLIRTESELNLEDFKIDKTNITMNTEEKYVHANFIKPLAFSDSVNHTINSRFLPPFVKEGSNDIPIKDFPKATNEPYNNFKSFENNILENKSISKETIKFYETSNFSNIIGQMFEIGDNSIGKLAIIDYGEFASDNKVKRHVYLLGEIINDAGEIKFCRTFTLVFSNES